MLFQVVMFPTSKGKSSVSEDVSKVIDIIDHSGLPYKLTAMSTIIEGEWTRVMEVLNKARKALRRRGHERIYISITIDDRKGARGRMKGKIDSIEKSLGREVKK
ncbi:MAG: MTH1187 family thiamine-binding protein [candidate division Zixibacteria bacterium]|nr:MTH1187 family thiamine-binding protein [candidate division Zixibacteria bacterium]